MDVLLNTIDLKDLLPSSSSALDLTTPLSAPDLRLIIDRLDHRSQHIKSKVQDYLLAHHQHFSELFTLCAESVSKLEQLSEQVSDLIDLISDRPIDVEIREAVDEIGAKLREVRLKRELLSLVTLVVELNQELKSVREMVRDGELVSAAAKLTVLKDRVRARDDDAHVEGEPLVYGLLKKEWQECFEEIQQVLVKFMEKSVKFVKETNTLHVTYQSNIDHIEGVELRAVLEAMEAVGNLEYGLARVADLVIKHVIAPAVNSTSSLSFIEEKNQNQRTLSLVQSANSKVANLDGEAIYSRVVKVIQFIYGTICLENSQWMQCFGRLTWPRISDLIISSFLSKVVPDDASKLVDFQNIIKLTHEFENSLMEMAFISACDSKDKKLSEFAENVEVHFAVRKKIEILGKARKLLLQCDFSFPRDYSGKNALHKSDGTDQSSSVYEVDLLFLCQRCVVSEAVIQLMDLVRQTLQDVCVSSVRVALEFYHAARDVLLLYEVVVPVKLERQLNGINQVAVLMHNDCIYLSQEILGLAFEYRSNFPSPTKELAVFVDMAPKFNIMAEEVLQRQIQLVCSNLKEAVDSADGFQNTHQLRNYESAKFSIDQVVLIIEKVRMIWEPLLLPSTYRKNMYMVLETVTSRITNDILFLDDIAAEETLQLQRLIYLFLDSLSYVLESLKCINEEGNSPKVSAHSPEDSVPSLRKIRKLADMLDMPLRSITEAWENAELVSCGFTLSEVKDFIKAIFTDSPLRRECLSRIESCSW
uniref:Centromere/kinetochore protein zw10-like protein n=1 Tax=Kalanchoe fedtschenkoi TaxID=63787 RepID=A0A7N0TAF6_KALFE